MLDMAVMAARSHILDLELRVTLSRSEAFKS